MMMGTMRSTDWKFLSKRNIAIAIAAIIVVAATDTLLWRGGDLAGHLLATTCDPSQYNLINPLFHCTETPAFKMEFEEFEDELEVWVHKQIDLGRVEHVSVYFRDLENGPWFGVDEDETFSAASLLKVPMMIAFLKAAETHTDLLEQKVSLEGNIQSEPNVPLGMTIVPGQSYSGEELLHKMIVYSDNASKDLIRTWLTAIEPDRDLLIETYKDIGLLGVENDLEYRLTVKTYASIFRILYNSTYLSKEMSQKALETLTHVVFQRGLVAGLPPGTKVAHKFGVRIAPDGSQQLHDCGIVYEPQHPYLICIMTRSYNMAENEAIIAEIARMVHAEVLERLN